MSTNPGASVLVGVGVASRRQDDPACARTHRSMLEAVRRAGADAPAGPGSLLAGVRRIAVPKGCWRYRNGAGGIACTIGDAGARSIAEAGVLQQTLPGDACRVIAQGSSKPRW